MTKQMIPAAPTALADVNGLPSETDPVGFLIGQHMLIRDLFTEVTLSEGDARAQAFERLGELLAAHEAAEQQIIRPMTRARVDGGRDIASEHIAEEAEANELLENLEQLGPDHERFPALFEQFRLAVLLHACHEEAHEFRYLKHQMDGRMDG